MELEAEKWRLCSTTLVRGVAGELEDCFLEAGIVSISLPPDFNWVGPAACERCQQLQIVDLSWTDIPEILGSTFAHCPQLQQLRLSKLAKNRVRSIPAVCLTTRGLHSTIPAIHSEACLCWSHAASRILQNWEKHDLEGDVRPF